MADISSLNEHKFRINQQPKFVASPHTDRVSGSNSEEVIGQIHQAVHKTRIKISNLKQEVANKDQEVKRERAMRKAAERGDQDKSTEGRGNSPPERKERTPTRSKPRHQGDEAEGQEQMTGESYCSSEEDRRMRERKGRRRGQARRGNDDEEWDERSSYSRRRHQPSSWYGEYGPPPPPPPHPAYTAPNPWISPHRVPPIPSYDPRLLHTIGPDYPSYAIPQHATSTPDHQRRHSSGDPNHPFTVPTLVIPAQTKESGQGDHVRSNVDRVTLQHSSPQGQSSTAPQQIPVTIQIQQSPTSTQHDRSPLPFTSMTESATKGESRLNTSDRSETVSTGVGTSPLQMPRNAPFDERGLPMLLDELGATKDKNQVLSEKCSEAKLEIESLKMQLGVKDAMSEAEIAAKGASLIEEIYTAQREHDAAIMSRLNLANDERDDAFARLQRYHSKDGFDSGTDVNSNEEDNTPADASLNNLLTRLTVADNRSSISKYGSAIIGRISKTKGRREEITSEEMRAILKEKDIAVAKCKKLEREVIELRRNKESSKSRNNNEKSLKAQLDITRDERDKALVAAKKRKDEIESLKVYYSLHKSLSQEANMRDQFNNTLGSIEEQVKTRDEVLARTQQNNSQLAQQVRAANDERNKMVVQLQRFEQENQHLKSKTHQLERLVAVLRKKVTEGTVKTV
ncbi:formin-like protein 13 isoform X2 [Strongylocentrotus purpuratus]|uniref:Mirror-image polydactyly 1 n=1 Tax=Strongylocentrotus purpuratus TaxID=7668 RepID=A0A7M7PT09_STRPU|nr:formin-like protein 13 isoform X2 [Strongylocentrotus purpuratus]